MVFFMLSAVCTIFKTGVFLLLLNDYVKRTYPEKYESLLVEIPLKMIYLYSNCQIIYGKLERKVSEFIDNNPQLKKVINDIYKFRTGKGLDLDLEIEYIINGDVLGKYKRTQSLPDVSNPDDALFIFSDLSTSEQRVNKKILQPEINFNYKISNIQFILLELKLIFKSGGSSENTYKIVLKTDEYNYYIVNNILDLKFFKYYLKKYYSEKVTSEILVNVEKMNVKLIDQDVNIKMFDLREENAIILKENEYIILE